jgi:TPR repeat protein
MGKVAFCYANGDGVKRSESKAAKWREFAAGQPPAARGGVQAFAPVRESSGAAKAHDQGWGLYAKNDCVGAVKCFLRAASLGSAHAKYMLGVLYAGGQGVPMDAYAAFGWYLEAATGGSLQAKVALGVCFLTGRGVIQNDLEALRWFGEAAAFSQGQQIMQPVYLQREKSTRKSHHHHHAAQAAGLYGTLLVDRAASAAGKAHG